MMGKRAWQEAAEGREGLLIQEGSTGNVPSGKLVANVIVIPELICCLGGHESKVLSLRVCVTIYMCVFATSKHAVT